MARASHVIDVITYAIRSDQSYDCLHPKRTTCSCSAMADIPSLDLNASQQVLGAARLVYDTFWGKDFDTLLQPVSNYSDFKHLSQNRLSSLRLDLLQYDEDVILVREEYKTVYKDLVSYQDGRQKTRSGGVVVTGQPGIGMHPLTN